MASTGKVYSSYGLSKHKAGGPDGLQKRSVLHLSGPSAVIEGWDVDLACFVEFSCTANPTQFCFQLCCQLINVLVIPLFSLG